MSISFRPPLWAVLGTVAGCGLMSAAGFWQLSRAAQKTRLLAQYDAAAHAPAVPLEAGSAPAGAMPRAARAQGEYLADRQLLLDGQAHGETGGYDVWTPLRLEDGTLVIVDRGWIPAGHTRNQNPAIAAPEGMRAINGLWRRLPQPALHLGTGNCADAHREPTSWPKIVEYPDVKDLRCLYGANLLDGELLLAPDAGGGFVRDWRAGAAEFLPSRHYAYAGQWFAFAATLLGLFIKLNLKRIR